MQETFEISQSSLEEARSTSDEIWLEGTFDKAEKVIDAGGKVNITQQFTDGSVELVAIIDTKELLDYYKRKYGSDVLLR